MNSPFKSVICLLLTLSFAGILEARTQPRNCSYTAKTSSGPRTKEVVCNDFDSSVKKSYSNVCVYVESSKSWQYGKLAYNSKTGKHNFTMSKVCDEGIAVVGVDKNIEMLQPSQGDAISITPKFVTRKSSGDSYVYTSLVSKSPMANGNIPYSCFRDTSSGIPAQAVPCGNDPAQVNFCEFALVSNSSGYKGNWWVQYTGINRGSRKLCKGGISSGPENE